MPPPSRLGVPAPGDLIGPYRVLRELGRGGMGTVFEAADTALHRNVALKVITPALAGDPSFRARFVREAQSQASLDSPHVVQVFAHGEVDGCLYIATQLIPDGDLGRMLRRHGPPPPDLALDLIAQVADGLAEAHRAGLVHRDIKPANVLLRKRGPDTVAYLADFGIARQLSPFAPSTIGAGGIVAGTPTWMAPELHHGAQAGRATDIYALGCLLWATLTGQAPYVGTTDQQVVAAHTSAPVPQLPGRSAFEQEVNRILRTAMAKDPAQRHPSAAALRDDLRRARALAAPASVDHRRRGRTVALAVAAVAAIAAAVVAAVVQLGGDGEPSPRTGGSSSGPTSGSPSATESPSTRGVSGNEEETAIANIAATLEEQADLDAASAECTARGLVEKHGVDGLQERGLLDDDLMLTQDGSGQVDPKVLADVFTATFSCLWDDPTS